MKRYLLEGLILSIVLIVALCFLSGCCSTSTVKTSTDEVVDNGRQIAHLQQEIAALWLEADIENRKMEFQISLIDSNKIDSLRKLAKINGAKKCSDSEYINALQEFHRAASNHLDAINSQLQVYRDAVNGPF
jgi:outer membrane murein-binding lipoprotein Lpp